MFLKGLLVYLILLRKELVIIEDREGEEEGEEEKERYLCGGIYV